MECAVNLRPQTPAHRNPFQSRLVRNCRGCRNSHISRRPHSSEWLQPVRQVICSRGDLRTKGATAWNVVRHMITRLRAVLPGGSTYAVIADLRSRVQPAQSTIHPPPAMAADRAASAVSALMLLLVMRTKTRAIALLAPNFPHAVTAHGDAPARSTVGPPSAM